MDNFTINTGDYVYLKDLDLREQETSNFYYELKNLFSDNNIIDCKKYVGLQKISRVGEIGKTIEILEESLNESNSIDNAKLVILANYIEQASFKETIFRFLTIIIFFLNSAKKSKKIKDYIVLIFKKEKGSIKRTFLKNEYYYISFAYCFFTNTREYIINEYPQNGLKNSLDKEIFQEIDNRIIAYHRDANEKTAYKHLSRGIGKKSERIITQIPLTPMIYRILTIQEDSVNYVSIIAGYELCALNKIINDLEEKTKQLFPATNMVSFQNINKIVNKECRLVKIFYYLTVLEMAKDKKNVDDLQQLFEYCRDVCQGLQQILENVILHANPIQDNNFTRNNSVISGILTIRVRENAKYITQKNNEFNYIIECYVNDIQYNNFCSMQERFIENAINNKSWNKDNQFTNQLIELKQSMTLENFFASLANPIGVLKTYYNDSKNVSNHYGLQIFFNIINNNDGYVKVTCGSDHYESGPRENYDYTVPDYNYINGTEYVIFSPVQLKSYKNRSGYVFVPNITPIDIAINQINLEWKVIFDKLDIYKAITQKESNIENVKENILKNISYQNFNKETILVINCYELSNSSYNIEILIKAIFLIICQDKKKKIKNIALVGFEDQFEVLKTIRFFGLFFNRSGDCELLSNDSAIFIADQTISSHILLFGKKITSISNHLMKHLIFGGISEQFSKLINSIIKRSKPIKEKSHKENTKNLFNFFYNIIINDNGIIEKIWQKQLRCVLETDIHSPLLGCKIAPTHIKIGKIHMDTFYEAQFLFGNAYWCSLFSSWLENELKKKISDFAESEIFLIGNENLLQPLLHTLKMNYLDNVEYCIYEGEKYIKRDKKSNPKFRNLENIIQKIETLRNEHYEKKIKTIFLTSISSTLTTHYRLKEDFFRQLISKGYSSNKFEIYYYTIIQSLPSNCDLKSNIGYYDISNERDFEYNRINKVCSRYFFTEPKREKEIIDVHYIVDVFANWYKPNQCILCGYEKNKYSIIREKPLISTDDTSLIPSQMIFLDSDSRMNEYYQKDDEPLCGMNFFMKDNSNKFIFLDFLYYNHLNRDDHHFQYYIRTEALLRYIINSSNEFSFKGNVGLKYQEYFAQVNKILGNNKNSLNDNIIDVLIAPAHYSNEIFCSEINKNVFDSKAHIIQFDAKKEYRSNFETKFSNFSYLINNLEEKSKSKINFYFVDDQIITGATFFRTKSYVQSMLLSFAKRRSISSSLRNHYSLFEGIFVVVDRNSKSSKLKYMKLNEGSNIIKNYFALFNIAVPSFRNYGDTCPLCKNVDFDRRMWVNYSNLSVDAFHWQKRQMYHYEKTLDEVKKIYSTFQQDIKKKQKYFRRFHCDNLIWTAIKSNNNSSISESITSIILETLNQEDTTKGQLEYLISFFKVITRPTIIYRENIKKYSLEYLLKIASIVFDPQANGKNLMTRIFTVFNLKKQESYLKKDCLSQLDLQDFRKIIISCLVEMNSNFLIDIDNLSNIYDVLCSDADTLDSNIIFLRKSVQKLINDVDYDNKKKIFFDFLKKHIKDKYSIETICNDEKFCNFWMPLYLESYCGKINNSKQIASYINEKFTINKKYLNIEDKEIDDNFDFYIDSLEFEKKNIEKNQDRFLPLNKFKGIYKDINIFIDIEKLNKNGFYFEKNQPDGIWIKVSNNYERIENEIEKNQNYEQSSESNSKEVEFWARNLQIQKTYSLYCFIRLEGTLLQRLEKIADFSLERKNILEINMHNLSSEYVKDFISTRIQNEILIEPKIAAHGGNHDLFWLFSNIDYIYKNQFDSKFNKIFLNNLSVLADFIISIGYRNQYNPKYNSMQKYFILEKEPLNLLKYTINCLSNHSPVQQLGNICIKYNYEDNDVNFICDIEIEGLKNLDSNVDLYHIAFFRTSFEYIITSVLFIIFLQNAVKYSCDRKVKVSFYYDEDNNLWLKIINNYLKQCKSSENAITSKTLRRFLSNEEYIIFSESSKSEECHFVYNVNLLIGRSKLLK